MGRKKIQIKPITDEKVRKVTFNRRRNGILKKAYELSILCDTQVVVLMFDHKEMCHVYSSEEGQNSHARLMEKYITKDFCTVDPIRNYDTSPDLQLEDPSQAVWRVSREKVAVVNTYNVIPATGTPHLSSSKPSNEDEDDDEIDGSEQLSVKSQRTYHTKNGDSRFGINQMHTPALTDKAQSPVERSISPDARAGQNSPRRSPKHAATRLQEQSLRPPQQGLGISGGGFTPLLRPGEQFAPILYPPQPPQNRPPIWLNSNALSSEHYSTTTLNQQLGRPQYLPNGGIQYASLHLQNQVQYPPIDSTPLQYIQNPLPPQPLLRQSPRKEKAHFNHYTYPRQSAVPDRASTTYPHGGEVLYESQFEKEAHGNPNSPNYGYESESDGVTSATGVSSEDRHPYQSIAVQESTSPQRLMDPVSNSTKNSPTKQRRTVKEQPRTQEYTYIVEKPELQAPQPERRITRSQSRSPQMKSLQLPARPMTSIGSTDRAQVPLHLRGPSLLDEITFDPVSGTPMMEASALASWLGTNSGPLQGVSPGHSRETSHVRGESVSQWLNMPATIPE